MSLLDVCVPIESIERVVRFTDKPVVRSGNGFLREATIGHDEIAADQVNALSQFTAVPNETR